LSKGSLLNLRHIYKKLDRMNIQNAGGCNMRALNLTHENVHDPHHEVELFEIGVQMKVSGLSDEFIAAAIKTAIEYEGVSDLVVMWSIEDDDKERDEIVADIQDMIDTCSQNIKIEHTKIRFNNLQAVAKDIRQFKDSLLEIVMSKGGLTKLSEKSGIPQSSLSRFFNSNSMPRRATLLKIGQALQLSAIDLESKWSR